MSDPRILLEVRDVARDFDVSKPWLNRIIEGQPEQILKAVDGISFTLNRGETLSLVGESGCGKSTIARVICGLYKPSRGSVIFDGVDMAKAQGDELQNLRKRFQMIFQDPYASLNPRWRVGKIVAEPILSHNLIADPVALKKRVDELLSQVGLSPLDAEKFPHEFSGGQRQRIAIARALAVNPKLLICDEPTSALDVSVQAQILNLLKSLQNNLGLAFLFITHNIAVVEYLADEVAVMYLGRIVEHGYIDEVIGCPKHPYTQALLSSVPQIQSDPDRKIIHLKGDLPSPAAPPAGCHFHPRCPKAMAICRESYPPVSAFSATHTAHCFLYPQEQGSENYEH